MTQPTLIIERSHDAPAQNRRLSWEMGFGAHLRLLVWDWIVEDARRDLEHQDEFRIRILHYESARAANTAATAAIADLNRIVGA